MVGATVSIEPEILQWIMQRIQFQNVNSAVFELLEKWQSGEKVPTFNQLEEVSKKINIPFGYFFLDEPPVEECKIVEYRTVKSTEIYEPSRNLIDILDMMFDAQEWMAEYLRDNGYEELKIVGSKKETDSVYDIADDIRKKLELNEKWYENSKSISDSFRYLRKCAGDKGIMIMMSGIVGNNTHRKLDLDEFRAFTIVDTHAPLIFINTSDSESGKLFSLLHEIVHIWFGKNSFYNEQYGSDDTVTRQEQMCNAVAAEILVPDKILKQKWQEVTGEEWGKVETLAKHFKCSQYVVVRKAFDAGIIEKRIYDKIIVRLTEIYQKWLQNKRDKKNSGGDFYKTLGNRMDYHFIKALEQSAKSGRTQYTEVYRLTNTNRKTFSKLIDEMDGVVW